MGYLICEECGMHYKLKEGETAEDFEDCECGGELKEVENLDDINDNKPNTPSKEIKYSIWTGKPIINKSNSSKGVSNEDIKKNLEARRKGLAPIKPNKTSNSQNIICENCGKKNPHIAKFCTECASPLNVNASKKFCNQCGTENLPKAQFCQNCGYNMSNKSTTADLRSIHNNEYLDILKKQEQHSREIKHAILIIFFIVVVIIPLIFIWYYLNVVPKYYYYP